ncbi:MAG: hypothetical protein R3Y13_04070 [bacterium]
MENKKNNGSKKSNNKTAGKTTATVKKTSTTTVNKTTNSSSKKTNDAVKTKKNQNQEKSVKDLEKIREEQKPKVDLIKVEKSTTNSKYDFEKIKFYLYGLAIIMIALGVLFNNNLSDFKMLDIKLGELVMPVKLIGFMTLVVTGIADAMRSEKNALIKSVIVIIAGAILGSWIFPAGQLSSTQFVETPGNGITINDIINLLYNGVYMTIDKIIMIFAIGMFYKTMELTGAYHTMVSKMTENLKGKGKELAFAIALIVILLTSLVNETYAVLFFLPLFISILVKLKIDKVTAFTVTFGALIAGTISSPYGTEGISGFSYYTGIVASDVLMYRIVLQICVAVLFIMYVGLKLKDNKEELVEENFLTEEENEKVNYVPLMVIMTLASIFLSLGYINWFDNFEIELFQNLHEKLFEITLGEYAVFELLLGSSMSASVFGTFTVFDGVVIVTMFTLLTMLAYRIKLDKIVDALSDTFNFFAKPILLLVLITVVFTVAYSINFTASVAYYLFELTEDFNPFTSALAAMFTGLFHADVAFTGYLLSSYISTAYNDVLNLFGLCFTSIAALIQLIVPTSPLLFGLYYTKVPYTKWVKYIAVYFAGILIVTLLLLTIITYVA